MILFMSQSIYEEIKNLDHILEKQRPVKTMPLVRLRSNYYIYSYKR